jgi:hypothetical protein
MALKTRYTAEDILVRRYRRGDENALPIVLEMFYLNDMKLHEINKALNVPAGTIKSRLFHARENLKKMINSKEE